MRCFRVVAASATLTLAAMVLLGCGSGGAPPSVVTVAEQEAQAAYGHALADARKNDRRGVEYWIARAHDFVDVAKNTAAASHSTSTSSSVGSWALQILGSLGGVFEVLAAVAAG